MWGPLDAMVASLSLPQQLLFVVAFGAVAGLVVVAFAKTVVEEVRITRDARRRLRIDWDFELHAEQAIQVTR